MATDRNPAAQQPIELGAADDEEAVEAERARIAHELHDDLLPLLFAARMHAQRLTQQGAAPPLAAELTALADELGEAMASGRRLLVGLHPPELSGGDWHQALRHYIDRGLSLGNTRVRLQLQAETAKLPAPRALAVYRIVQEAMRNAVRHAHADDVEISATATAGAIQLTVRDNGRGFDPAAIPNDRFGVRGIRERAQRAGGHAVIRSQPGAGTTIEIILPPS